MVSNSDMPYYKFPSHSAATEVSVRFQSNTIISIPNPMAYRLHKILQQDILLLCDLRAVTK